MATHISENLNQTEPSNFDVKNKSIPQEGHLEKLSHDAGKKMGAMTSDFTNKASDYVKTGRDYVKEHPTTGVAIAAAAGLVAGSLLTIALKRKH